MLRVHLRDFESDYDVSDVEEGCHANAEEVFDF